MRLVEQSWRSISEAVHATFVSEGATCFPPQTPEEWRWLAQSVADLLCTDRPEAHRYIEITAPRLPADN